MASLIGADLSGMEKLRSDLVAGADTLTRLISAIDGDVQTANTIWHGADAADFVATWQSQHRPLLGLAVDGLRAAGDAVDQNRSEQEQTSTADFGAAGSTGPAFSVDPASTGAAAGTTVYASDDGGGDFGGEDPGGGGGGGAPGAGGEGTPERPTPQEILDDYQIEDDEIIDWKPKLGGLPWIRAFWQDPIKLTATEGQLLDELASREGLKGLNTFKDIRDQAFAESTDRFEPTVREFMGEPISGNFDHTDAYRHTYWSALLAAEFGPDFARAFTQAHEGVPGNPADMESMDLYNNEVGVRIAEANPDASPEELADLVQDAVENGDVVVIDSAGDLAFSDDVAVGDTGVADDAPNEGDAPDDWDPGS